MASPAQTMATTSGPLLKASSNLILKGKTIPLVLEKSKSGGMNHSTSGGASGAVHEMSNSKVPNILRQAASGSNPSLSPSKNTIERQVVSHEATIELRKSCNILNNAKLQAPPVVPQTTKTEVYGKKLDLLQPIVKIEDEVVEADLSEINLKCEKNELGLLEVKSMPLEVVKLQEDSVDLMCRETLEASPP